jgi:hypothetical protein
MKKEITWPAQEFTLQDLIGLNPQFDPLTLHFVVNRKLADGSVTQRQSGLLLGRLPRSRALEAASPACAPAPAPANPPAGHRARPPQRRSKTLLRGSRPARPASSRREKLQAD